MSIVEKSMGSQFTRRSLLAGTALTLVACSEADDIASKNGNAGASGDGGDGVDQITTASVDVPAPQGSVDMDAVLAPSNLKEMELGDADAPVTIVEYASLTCPHCKSFHDDTFKAIKEAYVDTGKVRFIYRDFPFDPRAAAASMLARCAPENQYFPMIDMFFEQQTSWSRAEDARGALQKLSKLAGFTQESFEACLTNQQLLDDVTEVRNRASEEFGVSSTPTFIINGDRYSGSMSVEVMSAVIDTYL